MSVRDYLTATNAFAWFTLIAGAFCYFVAIMVVLANEARDVERFRNNWFVVGSVFLLVGLTIVVTIGTLGLQATT